MKVDVQTGFGGGMCDPRRGMPADSYSLAVNCDIGAGGVVTRRPLAYAAHEAHTLLHVSEVGTEYFGVQYLRIRRRAAGLYADAKEVGDDGQLRPGVQIRFAETVGGGAAEYISETGSTWKAEHASAFQIGDTLYFSFAFTGGVSLTYSGHLKDYQLTGGGKTRYLVVTRHASPFPLCRAAVYAFRRVWLAACQPGTVMRYYFVAVSDAVDGDAVQPPVGFSAPLLAIDFATSSDVLGFCPLGGSMLVFKRGGVWRITGCEGEPAGMRVGLVTGRAGAVGPNAWCVAEGACWFLSDGGLWRIGPDGGAECVTGAVAGFWRESVFFGDGADFHASLCEHGGRLLMSVPYGGAGPCDAFLVWALDLGRFVGVWTGEGFGGRLLGAGRRGTFAFGDGGWAQVCPGWVVSSADAAHDDLKVTLYTREVSECCGRHFCICVRVGLRNAPDYDGALHAVSVSATVGNKTITKSLEAARGVLTFMFGCASEALRVELVFQGGFVTIEMVSVGYVLRPG